MKNKLLLISVILSLFSANIVFAQDNSTPPFTIFSTASELKYTVGPGSKIIDRIYIKNMDPTRKITTMIEIKKSTGEPATEYSSWIKTDKTTVEITPNEIAVINLEITIPEKETFKELSFMINCALINYQGRITNDKGNLGVMLSIARDMTIKIQDIETGILDFTKNEDEKMSLFEKTKIFGRNLYYRIDENFDYILLIIIIALLIKLATQKNIKDINTSPETRPRDTKITKTIRKKIATTKPEKTKTSKKSTKKKQL